MASDRIRGNSATKTVVLDSSAILMIFEFSIDIEKELARILGSYKIIVPKTIFTELKNLSEQGSGKKKQIAKPALKFVERYEIVEDTSKFGDDSVIELAKKYNGIVFSNDKELRKKSRKEKLKTICLRGKKYLIISEDFV
jgi:rRNA-processing protein FCF1